MRHVLVCAALVWLCLTAPIAAQERPLVQTPILVLEVERLYSQSVYGQRVARQLEQAGAELAAENRQIEADLTAEERELTEQRPTLAPDEFRQLAAAFDEKVQEIRREQDAKARALGQRSEEARRAFLGEVQPILTEIMRDTGAAVIVERRNVIISADVIDITDVAIERIDASLGDGADEVTPADP